MRMDAWKYEEEPTTVGELVEELKKLPEDMPLLLDYDTYLRAPNGEIRWLLETEKGFVDGHYSDLPAGASHASVVKVLVLS